MSDRHRSHPHPHPHPRHAEAEAGTHVPASCPTEDELLRLLDGELASSRAGAVRDHVHACWSCRARYEALKATIGAFVDVIEGPVRASIPPPPRQWTGFHAKLRAAAAERRAQPAPSLSARLGRMVRAASGIARAGHARARSATTNVLARASMRHVLTSTALAALVALFIAFVPASPRLSAQVILDHAMAADSRRVAQVARPVTRQRFEASRRVNGRVVERAQWELYHDVQSGRARVYAIAAAGAVDASARASTAATFDAAASDAATARDADASVASAAPDVARSNAAAGSDAADAPGGLRGTLPPLAAEVVRLLEAHDWDGGGPLSSASYNRWRRSIAHASTDYATLTLDDGRTAYRVRARMPEPVRTGAIASAGLVVRADDWHAVRQDLEVRTATGTDDIQITELAFDVLRFDRLAAGIFADETHATAPASTPLTAPRPPSVAELDAAEMSVRYALHRLQADRGEPIQIVRGPSRVTVRGLVDSTARATELEAALGRIAGVRVDLTALDRLDPNTIAAARAGHPSSRSRSRSRGQIAAAPGALPSSSSPSSSSPSSSAAAAASGADATVLYADRSIEPPLQPVIDAFLAVEGSGAGSGERASLATRRNAFVARTLAASDRAMADAWALRRLADRYPRDAVAGMSERSSELLEEMVRDHVRELIVSTSAWRAELSALAPFARARLTETSSTRDVPSELTREPWPAYGATMFRVFLRAQSSTTDGLVGVVRNESEALQPHAAERHLLALLDDLTALEQMLRRLDDEARQGRRLTTTSQISDPTSQK